MLYLSEGMICAVLGHVYLHTSRCLGTMNMFEAYSALLQTACMVRECHSATGGSSGTLQVGRGMLQQDI